MLPRSLLFSTVIAFVMTIVLMSRAFAQTPFVIDGVVPANGTVAGPMHTPDPSGGDKELGPVNGTQTKVA